MTATPTRGLGKGLSVLISEEYSKSISEETKGKGNDPQLLGVDRIVAGKFQPRTHFSDEYLAELSESIKRNGIMQPLVVRPIKNSQYEIIAGERRWRAAKLAGLLEVPVIVRHVEDRQALELALIENIQRQDLSPLEEAAGFQRLIDEFAHTQEELAKVVGKSRSHVANLLRLLSLPEGLKSLLSEGKITMGHARALMSAKEPENLAEEVVRRGLNVRQTENLCRGETSAGAASGEQARALKAPRQYAPRSDQDKDEDILALEETLTGQLGLKVAINAAGESGEIVISYDSLTQLDSVIKRLGDSY